MPVLRWVAESVTTMPPDTSEPVPDVVGMVTNITGDSVYVALPAVHSE